MAEAALLVGHAALHALTGVAPLKQFLWANKWQPNNTLHALTGVAPLKLVSLGLLAATLKSLHALTGVAPLKPT